MQTVARASIDTGLSALEMLLRLRGIDVGPDHLRRIIGPGAVGVPEMLRCADAFDLKARAPRTKWKRLAALPLPGVATLRGHGFVLVGKASRDGLIILAPEVRRPALVSRADFEAAWDGQLVLMTQRGKLSGGVRRLARAGSETVTGACERIAAGVRQFLNPAAARHAVHQSATAAGAVIIDFTDRARRLSNAMTQRKPAKDRAHTDDLAFLPAALEIAETPPSPVGRAIGFAIIALVGIALVWACIGAVDVVAVAPGKIIPSGRTKSIQPFEIGVVRAIRVADGQSVKAGDVLIELDPTMSGAELKRLKSDLTATQLEAARLRAGLSGSDAPLVETGVPQDTSADLVEMQRRILASQNAEQAAKLAAIDRQIGQKQAERATIQASIEKLNATITPLQERVDIRKQLFGKGLGSKLTYLSELQELLGQQHEALVQSSRYAEADAAIAALTETRNRTAAEFERALLDDLAKAEQRARGLAQEIIKAEQRTNFQTLTAPVDGTVQQLAVHTIGGVVTPAQTLMLIVPANSHLEIEAMISNRDIGFVAVGQDVAVKIDTFNFTRYGLLHGKVLTVSHDAIARDKPLDKPGEKQLGAETSSSEPKGQELIYATRVSVDQAQMEIENRRVSLSPGMAVTVEIKTASRSIASYLLSPLVRYKHESLRER